MGLQDFFRKLFAAEPVRVDYRGVTTERLLELWSQRHQLTEAAVVELQAEAARRSVELPQPRPRPAPKPALPPRQPITGQHVWVLPPAAVVLRTEGAGAILCLLPTTEPGLGWLDSLAKDRSVEVEAVVAFNAAPGGHLPTSLVASALKLRPQAVFLLDASQPADRPHAAWPSTTPLSGVRLPKRLDRGFLRLGVMTGRPNALVASWNDGDELRALIGADVRCADVATRSASHVIGGLVPELGADALDALLELDEVVFLQGVPGVQPWPEPLAAMGIDATVVRTRRDAAPADGAMERVARALASTDDTALGEVVGALTDTELETVTTALLLGREGQAEAERVTRLACARRPDSASAWFQRGVVAFVRGAHAEALDAYLRATRATAPEPRAWVNLAAMHGRQGEWAEALRYAEAAHQAMPGDELALHHRLGALLGLGRVGDARALLEDSSVPDDVRTAWRAQLESGSAPPLGPDFFPHLARAALQAGVELRTAEPLRAVEVLTRGLGFDPRDVALRLELGSLLGTLGRDVEAEAVASDGMPWCRRPAELASLRFNRASARLRTGRLDAATGDLSDCLELMPGFTEARAQLVSVLTAKGAFAEARAHLATLRQANAPAALLFALEAQLDEAVRRGP